MEKKQFFQRQRGLSKKKGFVNKLVNFFIIKKFEKKRIRVKVM